MSRCALVVAMLLTAASAPAQDFSDAAPPAMGGPHGFLERGLPAEERHWAVEATTVRWFGLPELATRSFAIGGGWRPSRWAVGLSRTGGDDLGWSSAGAAAGMSAGGMAAALRACVRRAANGDVGVELGVGAWSAVGERIQLWASAPQLWIDGSAPPLERHLQLGLQWTGPGVQAWLARAAAPSGRDAVGAEHAAGIVLASRGLLTWVTLRDRPARGGFGVGATVGGLRVAAEIESHPVLPETTRLSLGWQAR